MIAARKRSSFPSEGFRLLEFPVHETCSVLGRTSLKGFNVENRMFLLFEKYGHEYLIAFLINQLQLTLS